MTANTPQSRKSKGRSFQKLIASMILEHFPELTENDVKSTSMGKPGSDLEMSQKAIDILNIEPECKFVEKLNIHEAYEQACKRVKNRRMMPIVFFKKSRSQPLVCLSADTFLNLLSGYHELLKYTGVR